MEETDIICLKKRNKREKNIRKNYYETKKTWFFYGFSYTPLILTFLLTKQTDRDKPKNALLTYTIKLLLLLKYFLNF